MTYVIAILGLGLACGLWVIVQQSAGTDAGEGRGCGECSEPGSECQGNGDCDKA